MARTDDRNSDGARASSATAAHLRGTRRANPLKYIPGFFYVLVFFIVGKLAFADPRATVVLAEDAFPYRAIACCRSAVVPRSP